MNMVALFLRSPQSCLILSSLILALIHSPSVTVEPLVPIREDKTTQLPQGSWDIRVHQARDPINWEKVNQLQL